jgi:hypothetical protein
MVDAGFYLHVNELISVNAVVLVPENVFLYTITHRYTFVLRKALTCASIERVMGRQKEEDIRTSDKLPDFA